MKEEILVAVSFIRENMIVDLSKKKKLQYYLVKTKYKKNKNIIQ